MKIPQITPDWNHGLYIGNGTIAEKKENKMKRELQLKSKMVYGRELIYPVCEDSKIICQMLNVKTLNDFHIRKLTALDYRMAFNEEDYLFNCQN